MSSDSVVSYVLTDSRPGRMPSEFDVHETVRPDDISVCIQREHTYGCELCMIPTQHNIVTPEGSTEHVHVETFGHGTSYKKSHRHARTNDCLSLHHSYGFRGNSYLEE